MHLHVPSEHLLKCTPEIVAKYKFYTPLPYSKEDSSLPPLAGGKVVASTTVEDHMGHGMMAERASQAEDQSARCHRYYAAH